VLQNFGFWGQLLDGLSPFGPPHPLIYSAT
jgi:hypothetical protein